MSFDQFRRLPGAGDNFGKVFVFNDFCIGFTIFPTISIIRTSNDNRACTHTIFESNSSVWTDLIYYTSRPRMFFSSNSNSRERLTCDMIFNVENQWIIGLPLLDQFNGKYEYTFWFIFQKEKCQKYSWYLSYCGIEKSLTTRYEILIFKCQKYDNFETNSFLI